MKYLDDPKGVFGGAEDIHTIVRKGLEQDAPGAYTILDQFSWEPSDMETVMVDVTDGMDPAEAAEKWIEANPDKVADGRKVLKREMVKRSILSMLPGTQK